MHCILINCFLQLKLTLLYIKDHKRVMCKKYYSLYPITMATDSIGGGGGGNKYHARRVIWLSIKTQHSALIEILRQGPAAMAKGYKLVIIHFLGLPAKYNYSALASPWPRIVFCLQPLEVGYDYYIQTSTINKHARMQGTVINLNICRGNDNNGSCFRSKCTLLN